MLSVLAKAVSVGSIPRVDACGTRPGNPCRFVYDRTGSVGLAQVTDWLAGRPLKIALVVVGAFLLNRIVRRGIRRFAGRVEGLADSGRVKRWRARTPSLLLSTGEVNVRSAARARTVATVMRGVATAVIWTFAFIYVLGALGLSLGPLLAGAGVAGVALGFGAQSLVRDFLTGVFLVIEDQFGVGDVVNLGTSTKPVAGSVEAVSLRVTRLRDINGTVWHVPNGQILQVGNMSQQWARALVDIAVAPTADLDRAAAVMAEAATAVWAMDEAATDVLEEPEVLGVEYLGPDAATIRVQGKTRPGAQWRIMRLLRVQIAEALEAAGIDLPPARFMRPPPA